MISLWLHNIPEGVLKNALLTKQMVEYVGKELKGTRKGEIKLALPVDYFSLDEIVGLDPSNVTQAELLMQLKIILSDEKVTDVELRAAIPENFGRYRGICWVYWME